MWPSALPNSRRLFWFVPGAASGAACAAQRPEPETKTSAQRGSGPPRSPCPSAERVAEQQAAVLVRARRGQRRGLRGPKARAGNEDVGPAGKRTAQLGVIAREPIVLFRLRDGATASGRLDFRAV